ncbi:MAG: site-2 protease family protein [Eggerthellaceae bacterium]|jgi:regulator of sigma E protease
MDVVWMIIYLVLILSVLVFIHEGGHFLVARAFKVRVSEFMLGFPGPNLHFTWHGTKFGVTVVPLGGYARVCGMEPGEESPHLRRLMALAYEQGSVTVAQAADVLEVSEDEARDALDELFEWGTLEAPKSRDEEETYRTPERDGYAIGQARPLGDVEAFYQSERAQQYRMLPFWKRICIVLAGPGMNLLFAVVAFIVIYSILGVDYTDASGVTTHLTVDPLRAVAAGFHYIWLVLVAIVGLFNPSTVGDTLSNSTSVLGIAVLSKSAADAGFVNFLFFMAAISVSLGLMNLIPIPPLDGGRFVVEIYQAIRRKNISARALSALSVTGMALFMGLFVVMLNQDIQRFIFGNW